MKPLHLIIVPLFLSTIALAQTHYVSQTIKTISDKNSAKTSGKILPTTSLEIVEKDGNKALVKLTGWSQNGIHRVLYFSKGKRIISAVFSKKAKYSLEKLKQVKIDGKLWEKITISTWVKNEGLNTNIDPIYKKASNLYQSNCSMCHPTPDIHHFNANQWPSIIKSMAINTALSKDDQLLITQYLQKHTDK